MTIERKRYLEKIKKLMGGNERQTVDEDGICRVGVIPFLPDDSIFGIQPILPS